MWVDDGGGDVVYYLYTDHLGSTSLATDDSGQGVDGSRTLYYPYGQVRWPVGGSTLPTDYAFTGQRADAYTHSRKPTRVIHRGNLTMNSERLYRTVLHVVKLLVQGRYDDLASLSERKHLKATDLRGVVEDYGCRLVMPPMDSLEELNVIKIENSVPVQWYVGVDLWAAEEGRSDLTLELTLTDSPGDLYQVELNDLHVL